MLIQFIGKEEKIQISEKELSDGMIAYASQYPGEEKKIMEYFKQNPMSIESVRGPILEQKVIERVLSKVKLSNKKLKIEEFKKLQEKIFKVSESN